MHRDGEFPFLQIPCAGLLSNGLSYVLYTYKPGDAFIKQSSRLDVQLKKNIKWQEARDHALPVMSVILRLLLDQQAAYQAAMSSAGEDAAGSSGKLHGFDSLLQARL